MQSLPESESGEKHTFETQRPTQRPELRSPGIGKVDRFPQPQDGCSC